MAKFVQVQTQENNALYINVEQIRYVAQNAMHADRCSVRFVSEPSPMPINESAASFISRASAN